MNHERSNERIQVSDEQLEQAIASFRQSVKNWSEQEHAAARAVEWSAQSRGRGWSGRGWSGWGWSGWWMSAGAVAAACAVAAVLLAGHGSGPGQQARAVRPVEPMQAQPVKPESAMASADAGSDAQAQMQATTQAAKQAETMPVRRAAAAQPADDSDEALLAAVDNDISQGTAKALAPMADWMGDSANR